jgi:hypothetical protein
MLKVLDVVSDSTIYNTLQNQRPLWTSNGNHSSSYYQFCMSVRHKLFICSFPIKLNQSGHSFRGFLFLFSHYCPYTLWTQWAGKTIALGTFPAGEADEKCARAKALTRAWRSTMRPKPSRDWVMLELERLGVRVVSGRLGRKAGEDEEGEKKPGGEFFNSCLMVRTMPFSRGA